MTIRTIDPAAARFRGQLPPFEGDEDRLSELLAAIRREIHTDRTFRRDIPERRAA
jgi:hypothetical protein